MPRRSILSSAELAGLVAVINGLRESERGIHLSNPHRLPINAAYLSNETTDIAMHARASNNR
jgi:hypothetical protein